MFFYKIMTIAMWLVISLIYAMCLQNTGNLPVSSKHKNTTVKNKTQSLKQKDLRTEATVESKSIDRRQEKNKATTETKSTNDESSNNETATEKSKTVIRVKLESKSRKQLGTESQPKPRTEKKGYMPICGIDSYEDEIFGCIVLEATKDTITPAATTTQEVKYDKIAYRQGGADGSSTDIIWVDGAPDVQRLPEEMDLCKGLAKCRLPFGSSNSSTV